MTQAQALSPPGGQYDETLSPDGSRLTHWRLIMDNLASRSEEDLTRRQAEINNQLRSNGIAFSPMSYADESPRPWNLDLAPFIIEPKEWQSLQVALDQRARLKQAILNDIYGEQSLLKTHVIPPALIFAHRGYLRDAVNPTAPITLPLYSADLSRGPSGEWYVVDEICQFPAGIGYALENRLVLSKTLSKLFRQSRVMRIANYFKHLQHHITELSARDGRCVILGPNSNHPHYFEISFLAKYLGYTLVQVEDLTIRNNQAFLKTVSGLQRVSVIFRFINDTAIDPLAVAQSRIKGIPGLFQAVRSGGVDVINPLGSGVLDNPALNTRLPELCQQLLGENLILKGPPTYWLGDSESFQHVNANLSNLLIKDIDLQDKVIDPQSLDSAALQQLQHSMQMIPERYVAQERIDRSVAPSFEGTSRVYHQITSRMFLVKQHNSYEAMNGGLCLLDAIGGVSRPAFDSLIGSKDTWVIAEGPVIANSLISNQKADTSYSVLEGELPSRVAENLFWMGRNAERCENVARLLRAIFQILQNDDAFTDNDAPSLTLSALLRATSLATGTLPGFAGRGGGKRQLRPSKELHTLLSNTEKNGTLAASLDQLHNSVASVRDRISQELFIVFNRLSDSRHVLKNLRASSTMTDDADALEAITHLLDNILLSLSAFTGLAHENFTHGDGWRFMMLGRRLERVTHTSVIMNSMLSKSRNDPYLLETILKLFDSTMTYRSRYRSQMEAELVISLIVLDEYNPRSLAYQLGQIDTEISKLPGRRIVSQSDQLAKLAISGLSRVRLADPASLLFGRKDDRQNLSKFLGLLERLPGRMSEVLTSTYFTHVDESQALVDLIPNTRIAIDP